jgi:ABC-type amino acid transport system permease subunit
MTNRVINIFAFSILTLLWLAFGAALLFNRELLDTVWQSFRSWPLVIQIVVGLLVLPVTLGLWIWQTSWPLWLRLILVLGLAGVTIYLFFPKKTHSQPESSSPKT